MKSTTLPACVAMVGAACFFAQPAKANMPLQSPMLFDQTEYPELILPVLGESRAHQTGMPTGARVVLEGLGGLVGGAGGILLGAAFGVATGSYVGVLVGVLIGAVLGVAGGVTAVGAMASAKGRFYGAFLGALLGSVALFLPFQSTGGLIFALAVPIVAGVIGYEMTIPSRRTSRQRKVFVRPTLQRTEEGAVLALAGVY